LIHIDSKLAECIRIGFVGLRLLLLVTIKIPYGTGINEFLAYGIKSRKEVSVLFVFCCPCCRLTLFDFKRPDELCHVIPERCTSLARLQDAFGLLSGGQGFGPFAQVADRGSFGLTVE
jgi:hypothetical protein